MANEAQNQSPRSADGPGYDPPQVERVIDADELAREVHYAGDITPISDFPTSAG